MKITTIICDICKKNIEKLDRKMTIQDFSLLPKNSSFDCSPPDSKEYNDICMNCQREINEIINLLKR